MQSKIDGLSALRESYDCILSDVWGVLHNGMYSYPEASRALETFRRSGGAVVLITNSPKPRTHVIPQLRELGLGDDAYDEIVTSGDVTRELIRQAEGPVYHLGPDRDLMLFDGLDVELADETRARTVVCTGLENDDVEVPEDYQSILSRLVDRSLVMICANPDIVVERGDRLVWCAGSLAQLYTKLGGVVELAGKPHAPIYDSAISKLSKLDQGVPRKDRILAIGDGMPTDVAGAQAANLDLLFISAGIHAVEYGGASTDPDKLEQFLLKHDANPVAWMPHLCW